MPDTEVLIVGAGPSGLVLALSLAHAGVRFRLIDKNGGPGQQSRAMAVQARTLEFYRQFGFGDETVARGIPIAAFQLQRKGAVIARLPFGDIGAGVSPYPFVLCFPQDDHERLLGEQLAALGVAIEWNTTLTSFADDGAGVEVTLRHGDADETLRVAYLCGCDGARSTVRQQLALDFPGGTYDQVFYVADVDATGDTIQPDEINLCLGDNAFCGVFPVRSSGTHRLIGVLPMDLHDRADVTFEDLRATVEPLARIRVQGAAHWFSTYHVHHRVAAHFRVGRVTLSGDAGHVHSPVGGQGMNTGIGDAMNLGWKLAAILQNRAAPVLLDTYETERIAFAHTLVQTTDQMFQLMIGHDAVSNAYRGFVLPDVLPVALHFTAARRAAFRLLSQTRIRYRDSALSESTSGTRGAIRAGDRLPWLALVDNFAPLRSLDWQLHIYGTVTVEVQEIMARARITVCTFPSEGVEAAGLKRDALYLVRPDGYVGFVGDASDTAALESYLERWEIRGRNEA